MQQQFAPQLRPEYCYCLDNLGDFLSLHIYQSNKASGKVVVVMICVRLGRRGGGSPVLIDIKALDDILMHPGPVDSQVPKICP